MKKFLFTIAALVFGVFHMNAQKIWVENVEIPEKGQATLTVKYETGGKTIVYYGFKMVLPKGLSYVMDENNEENPAVDYVDGKGFNLTYSEGNFGFLPAGKNSKIQGTEGTLFTLTLKADETLKQNDSFVINVENALFAESTEEGNKEVELDPSTFTVTIVEDRVIFKETDTKLPLYTAGETKNVRITRTLKPDQWNTIVLPFNLTAANGKKLFGDDVKYAQFDGFEVDYGPDEENVIPLAINIKFATYTIPPRGNLAGGTPILVKTTKEINTPLELDGVTLVGGVNNVSKTEPMTGKQGAFTGTFISTKIPANGLFINSEQFYYSTGKSNIKGFRGWFMLDEILGQETNFNAKVTFDVDGEATSIDGIPSYQRVTEGVYDLSGRKIQLQDGDLNKLQKGVYIINGKKVTIK